MRTPLGLQNFKTKDSVQPKSKNSGWDKEPVLGLFCAHTLGAGEVDDRLVLEDVDLLNPRDGVHSKALQCVLKPLVVRGGRLVNSLFLSAPHQSTAERMTSLGPCLTCSGLPVLHGLWL